MVPRVRKRELPWARAFWANYILILHAIAAVVVSLFMLQVVDGITVSYNSDEPWFRRSYWQADDITTAVSTAILVIRIITGAWATRSAWRCALILLETRGVTLRQFNRIISWPAYFLIGSTEAYITTLILLLLVPANLVAPVITGAVGWKNAEWEVPTAPFQHTGPAATTSTRTNLYWYSMGGPSLWASVLSTAGRAGVGWIEFNENNSRSSRLVTSSRQRTMPINSTIDNLTLPFLGIHSISWDKKSDFKKNITGELDFHRTAKSNLTLTGDRPFNLYHAGNAALFDEKLLGNYPSFKRNRSSWKAELPPPTVYRGTKKIALLVTRQYTTNCTTLGQTIFGNKTSMANLKNLYRYGNPTHENCFLIGTVDFTAGVIRKRGTFTAPRVIEAEAGSSASVQEDNWVVESLYLMPDVMAKISMLNMSQFPTWDNLEGYVEDLIRVSYQAAWGQVASQFNTEPLNFTAHEVVHGLRAVVSLPRVIGWYSAQFLVLVSATLLWILQRRSNRPITIDAGVVALLVDAAPVLNKYDEAQELSTMSYVRGRDGGTVQLAECDVTDSGEPRRRFMLVPRAGGG